MVKAVADFIEAPGYELDTVAVFHGPTAEVPLPDLAVTISVQRDEDPSSNSPETPEIWVAVMDGEAWKLPSGDEHFRIKMADSDFNLRHGSKHR